MPKLFLKDECPVNALRAQNLFLGLEIFFKTHRFLVCLRSIGMLFARVWYLSNYLHCPILVPLQRRFIFILSVFPSTVLFVYIAWARIWIHIPCYKQVNNSICITYGGLKVEMPFEVYFITERGRGREFQQNTFVLRILAVHQPFIFIFQHCLHRPQRDYSTIYTRSKAILNMRTSVILVLNCI